MRFLLIFCSLLFVHSFIIALPDYPVIKNLSFRDHLFVQLGEEISDFYKAEARNLVHPELMFFRHTLKEDLDLFSLASRCSLPYDTLASLNGFTRNRMLNTGESLLIPNIPGLFVPRSPRNDMDRFSESIPREDGISCTPFGDQEYIFYPGQRFGRVERAFFLGVFLGFPLREGVVSSRYGERIDPFTGHNQFHHGIDLAAPLGSEVLAAREGMVIFNGFDIVYGNYVILQHANGYQTLYGHLKKSLVQLNQEVVLGMIIGEVGVTGQTTGPHLHFEVRRKGVSRDPSYFIR
ncbi:M23 family metallopeptidase [Marispirochaeta sp.]|jgi:murein DD-endopeptidase MepM/ murein hydrolase activator NlpD|uniref:M23 family metallopeptidase n=1 Tax=Marispirochaeta sp. TaxID=2038653 RepID=UPI0029C95257|nr:M23 family metallopeptidase [Marispirochaeta sp.]